MYCIVLVLYCIVPILESIVLVLYSWQKCYIAQAWSYIESYIESDIELPCAEYIIGNILSQILIMKFDGLFLWTPLRMEPKLTCSLSNDLEIETGVTMSRPWTEWNSSILHVWKLNKTIHHHVAYLLLHMNPYLDFLMRPYFSCKLGLKRYYWQFYY